MNVLITATLLPSIVAELGGANLMSWPTTAFVASSIIAASGTGLVSGRFENRLAFSGGAVIYAAGAVLCACAPSIGFVIAGRFVQGLGGGLLSALAYVLVTVAAIGCLLGAGAFSRFPPIGTVTRLLTGLFRRAGLP